MQVEEKVAIERCYPSLLEADKTDLINIIEESCGFSEETCTKEVYINSLVNVAEIYFIMFNGNRIGTFELKQYGHQYRCELSSFGILPSYRRAGIGTSVLIKIYNKHPSLFVRSATKEGKSLYDRIGIPIIDTPQQKDGCIIA